MARPSSIVPAGKAVSTTSRLFAGAKEVPVLERYQQELGITHFDKAIEWGWFYWFEKPILALLHWLFIMSGNFGVAILHRKRGVWGKIVLVRVVVGGRRLITTQ